MPIAPNTLALFNFEQNALDSSGNGRDLSALGAVAYFTTPVPIPQGLYDAGSFSDADVFQTSVGADLNTALINLTVGTFELYLYLNTIDASGTVPLSLADSDGNTYYFYVGVDGSLSFVMQSGFVITSAPGLIATGAWYDIAATWDGVNQKIYINNVLVGTLVVNSGLQNIQYMNVGNFGAAAGFALDGFVDQFRISTVARTSFPTTDPTGGGAALLDSRRRR